MQCLLYAIKYLDLLEISVEIHHKTFFFYEERFGFVAKVLAWNTKLIHQSNDVPIQLVELFARNVGNINGQIVPSVGSAIILQINVAI